VCNLQCFKYKHWDYLNPACFAAFSTQFLNELKSCSTGNLLKLHLAIATPERRADQIRWDTAFPALLGAFPNLANLVLKFSVTPTSPRTFSRVVKNLPNFARVQRLYLHGTVIKPHLLLQLLKKFDKLKDLMLRSINLIRGDHDEQREYARSIFLKDMAPRLLWNILRLGG
jgi:hypothetical protein